MMEALVIAIAGPPGSGKTTLSRALAARLGGAPVLSYDAYEQITRWVPERVLAWLGRGAPFDEIPVPGLADDLSRLRGGEPVRDRETGEVLRVSSTRPAPPVLVLDTLLGRAHRDIGASIDHLIWLDVPLDVALARKLRSFTAEAIRHPEAAGKLLGSVDGYLGRYAELLHPTYSIQRERVRPAADQVLASGPVEKWVGEILSALPAGPRR